MFKVKSLSDAVPGMVQVDGFNLRQVCDDDLEVIARLSQQIAVARYKFSDFPDTVKALKRWLRGIRRNSKPNQRIVRVIVDPQQNMIIGMLSIYASSKRAPVLLGYWLTPEYWGRGVMTAVVRRCIELARLHGYFSVIQAEVVVCNQASRRVLEKNQFVLTGGLSRVKGARGDFHQVLLYSYSGG
jgi:[ribosomal protein S5]-alanine N-acetyltransferase